MDEVRNMTEERKPFRLPENTATLVLDGKWVGAEIDVNLSVGWAVYDAIGRWLAHWEELRDSGDSAAVIEALHEAAEIFTIHALRGWNLEDGRGPIPPTIEGLLSISDPNLMPAVIGAWLGAVGTVSDPLPDGSPDTDATPPTN
jgi:hypothetical protein